MRGRVSLAKKTVLIRSWSTAERQSSGLVLLNKLDGRAAGIGNADIDATEAGFDGGDESRQLL